MTPGFVYFIGVDDAVKVGKSNNPTQRIKAYGTHNPSKIVVYGIVESVDMDALERRLHAWFAGERIRGEWFRLSGYVANVVAGFSLNKKISELDLGILLASYERRESVTIARDNLALKRQVGSLRIVEREAWALHHAIRSLGLHDYPTFKLRYNEAMDAIKQLPDGVTPIMIRNRDGELKAVCGDTEIDTDAA